MTNNLKKIDKILELISDVRIKTGKIEQHLEALNNTIDRHETDISSLKKMVYKIVGGAAVLMVVIQIVTYYM